MDQPTDDSILERFSPATREWFSSSFAAPTPAQAGAWRAISSGEHSLVIAPTGSGKTLAAFLWAIDSLVRSEGPRLPHSAHPATEAAEHVALPTYPAATDPASPDPADPTPKPRCRVLYVSPLKALAVDVERNLRSPLVGIGHAAARLGLPRPELRVSVRSGDTPADERRRFTRDPSDILITTPESLFLMLTSNAREALRGVQTVIIDEIHAVFGTKRGAHLAVSLDRLDALLPSPAQRVGLSATVRPPDEVARFLAGGRPVTTIHPPADKQWDLTVSVPVPDMTELGEPTTDRPMSAAGAPRQPSIWPHVEERLVDLIEQHRSTLVFANSRRLAETLTSRLNEIASERATGVDPRDGVQGFGGAPHSINLGTTGYSVGPLDTHEGTESDAAASGLLARAHHGSVSREQRAQTEEALKAGQLPAVVATSSLELGIDMGAIDLVVQVEAPPSVASGLQRVGRAGHQVGATSRGVFFPKFRGDLVTTAVIVERMRAGGIESVAIPTNPLDVLAQQVVACVAMDDWTVDDLLALMRRSAPFAGLTRGVFESVLDMLAGRYPSEEFAELRPRLTWDRGSGVLTGRRGAQRVAVTSGGTIPDRGLFGVFIAGDGPGRRVGELDEEMVYESRVGDVITLGTSTWRIEDITHDQVLVSPAPGQAGRLPFWKGDTLGRPAELGAAVGSFVREVSSLAPDAAASRLAGAGLDAWASDNVGAYLAEQREATGVVPTDKTIVVERFTDELGDWRIVIHSPYGSRVHAPWALAIGARLRERYGVEVQAMHADDGIVLRLPDMGGDSGWGDDAGWGGEPSTGLAPLTDLLDQLVLDPDEIGHLVTEQVGGSALFASRFRECAGRALLLPNRRPGRRQALWQQRQRSAALLEVASRYPAFPIVLEAVRECLQDVFDLPALVDLMRRIRSREITAVEVTTPRPSPFAQSLLFGYVAQFLYEGDSPLAERRAAALTLDPDLMAELLGTGEVLSLRDLLDPAAIETTERELQHLTEQRRARDADDVTDLLRVLGPLSDAEIADRSRDFDAAWLVTLAEARRIVAVRIGGDDRWAAVDDVGRLRDALGVPVPPGLPDAYTAPTTDPLGDLLVRWARTHGPWRPDEFAARYGLGRAVVLAGVRPLQEAGRLAEGEFRPHATGRELCDPAVLRTIRRRSVAALRAEVEPVPAVDFARFLPVWQGIPARARGVDAVLRALEQLAGVVLPASAVESLVLPARVRDYTPALLDELCSSGEVTWRGHGALARNDGWVSFVPAGLDVASEHGEPDGDLEVAIVAALSDGGGHFFGTLVTRLPGTETEVGDALWNLVWKGLVTNDTLAPLRARLAAGSTTHRVRAPAARGRVGRVTLRTPRRPSAPDLAGRWSLLPTPASDPTVAAVLRAELLLDRYGVLTRGSVAAEEVPGGFAGVYRVLSAAEDAGRVRRGYFIEGLGAAQFATVGAIDRLRATRDDPAVVVLAASDPANPYGAALPWPALADPESAHRPSRRAGAIVVLDGDPLVWLERGGRTALTWSTDPGRLAAASKELAGLVHSGRLASLTIEKVDGADALGSSHPFVTALIAAGFHQTPKGVRLRR